MNKTGQGRFIWSFMPVPNDPNSYLQSDVQAYSNDYIVMLYNKRVISSAITSSLGLSVIGIYVSIVYVAGASIRAVFDRYSQVIMYEERP